MRETRRVGKNVRVHGPTPSERAVKFVARQCLSFAYGDSRWGVCARMSHVYVCVCVCVRV